MLLLDTNVLSVLLRAEPEKVVAGWISGQRSAPLYTTSICQAELWSRIAIMPVGHRRLYLEQAVYAMFVEEFDGRVLAFDDQAALAYAQIFAARRRAGRPGATADLMIAAIAQIHAASVVTRNVRDFDGCGVPVINPWDA
jgi:predicted nucleic acid-binding protein